MTVLRCAVAVALLLLGGGSGIAALAVHTLWWGLPLAAAALGATVVAVGPGWLTRLPFAVGFVLAVAMAVPRRPEGDYVVANGTPGWLLLLLTLLLVLVAVVTLPRPRRVAESAGVSRPT